MRGVIDLVDWTDPVNFQHPLNRGLLHWFLAGPVQTGRGSKYWWDIAGGLEGVLTNMDPATDWLTKGPVCGALDFDGTNDRVVLGSSDVINFGTGNWTISAWIIYSTANRSFLGNGSTAGNTSRIHVNASSDVELTNESGSTENFTTSNLSANKWWHVTAQRNSSTNTSCYVNGTHVGDGAILSASEYAWNNIGSRGTDFFWNGCVGDVRFWNRALSAGEIKDYYIRSLTGWPGLLNRIPLFVIPPEGEAAPAATLSGRLALLGVGL